ncbi:uncharacterized protein LOC131955979 [Physella acuta]|uniref:uncharacterized protein LOC131955979 n=1 Tax=Physella acuta TaxID=109671 RepID=UPI0027DD700C|nr:uncharacterized protein LOC131955979 [Physella acuta]
MDLFYVTLLVFAGLMCLGNCSVCPPTNQDIEKCFTNNLMSFPANFDINSLSVADKDFCDNLDNSTNAISCVLQLAIDCASSQSVSISDYMPSPSKARDLIIMSCRNVSVINQNCLTSKSPSITTCTSSKAAGIARSSSFDLDKIMCKTFEVGIGCVKPALESCGCATVQLQQDIMSGPLWPSKCQRPDFRTVQCDPYDPKSFLGSGSKMIPNTMLLFILFCILLFYKQ